ncbi:hypothetical protein ACGFYP_33800 [Streptomyces sp. NPDC048370]
MTTPLPQDPDETPEYGVPSPELFARGADGYAAFLARFEDDDQANEETTR